MARSAMGVLAPGHEPALLDAADELLTPLRCRMEQADLATLPSPAVSFDPLAAAGARTWRHIPLPAPPAEAVPDAPRPELITCTPAADLAALIKAGELSAAEVYAAFMERIRLVDPEVNAYLTVLPCDAAGASGPYGPLGGVPVGLKDLIDTAGIPTTCGSRLLADRIPAQDAEVWRRLRAAGATMLGKLNTHEFAAGVTSENEHYGPVRNPHNPDRIAGGSSGGAAAAVAAGMAAAALGTDTGGSIRIPAACCGTVGLKPTFGLVPTAGVYPLAWSLDHVGPVCRTVRDAALVLDVLAGTRTEPAARAGAQGDLTGIRIGVPASWLGGLPGYIDRCQRAAGSALAHCGATLVEVPLPDVGLLTAVNRVIAYAEGSAWHEPMLRACAAYQASIRPRQEAGRFLLAGEYLTALRLRAAMCTALAGVWHDADLLLLPTLPGTAPRLGSAEMDVGSRREPVGSALIRYTAPFNVTGTPALTLPYGCDDDGLPVGIQLAGPPATEALLCYVAAALEASGDELKKQPSLAVRM